MEPTGPARSGRPNDRLRAIRGGVYAALSSRVLLRSLRATFLFFILPYTRRRERVDTAGSCAGRPAIATFSYSRAIGIRRATSAAPFAESFTATSRLLLAERVRVTRP